MEHKTYKVLGLPYIYDEAEKPVLGFFGAMRPLSNFFQQHNLFSLFGQTYDMSERAYMYFKSDEPWYQDGILGAETAKACKALGYKCKLREGWDDIIKFQVMHRVLQAKFDNPDMWEVLAGTGNAYLEETNTWGDRVWGKCKGTGANHLGRILMCIRYNRNAILTC